MTDTTQLAETPVTPCATPAWGVDVWFSPKFKPLFTPKRYKVLYGGRGGLKTWGIARALIVLALRRKLRILCAREFQKSIKESVHEVLESQVKRLGLERYFEIQRDTIRVVGDCPGAGSEFVFIGLHLNTSNVKSYEDVDICWVEEAANVSRSSWRDLTPTIRKPDGGPFGQGAEIWISFNPELETDETYARFVLKPRSNSIVIKTSWRDNPYFPPDLRAEMEDDKRDNFDTYLHVWEGHCKQTLEGAVYADELRDATVQNRLNRPVPCDRSLGVSTYWDLGRSDHTSIWFVQQVGWEYHIIDFYQSRLKHIDHYLGVMQQRGYIYDAIWLPHDAKAKQLGSKMTIEEQAREKYPERVRIVPRVAIKDKINAARTVFPNCYFDPDRCAEGLQALRHYTYEVDPQTKAYSDKPLHDENSDAASAFEYFGVASKMPTKRRKLNLAGLPGIGKLLGAQSEDMGGTSPSSGVGWLGN